MQISSLSRFGVPLLGLEDEAIVGWWDQASEYQQLDFFGLLEICLYQFRYRGRRQILASALDSPSSSHSHLHSEGEYNLKGVRHQNEIHKRTNG